MPQKSNFSKEKLQSCGIYPDWSKIVKSEKWCYHNIFRIGQDYKKIKSDEFTIFADQAKLRQCIKDKVVNVNTTMYFLAKNVKNQKSDVFSIPFFRIEVGI